jgi:hypothetical protein
MVDVEQNDPGYFMDCTKKSGSAGFLGMGVLYLVLEKMYTKGEKI